MDSSVGIENSSQLKQYISYCLFFSSSLIKLKASTEEKKSCLEEIAGPYPRSRNLIWRIEAWELAL